MYEIFNSYFVIFMDIMNKRRKKDKDETMRTILVTAQNLLFESDYSMVNMESIALQAGVSKGTIFYYFTSKESLAFEVLKYSYYTMLNEFSNSITMEDANILDTIKKLLFKYLNQTKTQIGLTKLLLQLSVRSEIEVRKKIYTEICLPFYDEVENILRLLNKNNPKIKSRILIAIFDGLALQFYLEEHEVIEEKIDDYANEIFEMFVQNI